MSHPKVLDRAVHCLNPRVTGLFALVLGLGLLLACGPIPERRGLGATAVHNTTITQLLPYNTSPSRRAFFRPFSNAFSGKRRKIEREHHRASFARRSKLGDRQGVALRAPRPTWVPGAGGGFAFGVLPILTPYMETSITSHGKGARV
jgi:hypothetical protein